MGENMQLNDILIEEGSDIRTAVEQLERVRCKVIYVINNGKLTASVSDGDVRRFVLQDGDVKQSIKHIANYKPRFLVRYEKEKIDKIFAGTEMHSVPIVNYNHEVVEIVFRNGQRIRRIGTLDCPVVMMAGGKGTRLYPYTKILPKALIPIGDIPISERIISNFVEFGCKDFYMIVNHKKDMIQAYYDGVHKAYQMTYIAEDQPLGSGGGLYLLNGRLDQDFFLVNCDIIVDADYNEVYNYHIKENNYVTMVVAKYRQKVPYGVIECDENFQYRGIREKPEMDYLINTGMYVVNKELLKQMPQGKELSFPDLVDDFKKQGARIGVYTVEENAYMDMGQLEELEVMRKKLNV